MDRFSTYDGRRKGSHRRRYATGSPRSDKAARRVIKLFICVAIFVVATLIKLIFPSALAAVGEKLNTVVNYKAALTTLGEGLSGEKKFTAALGEALTYAFSAEPSASPNNSGQTGDKSNEATITPTGDASGENNTADKAAASGDTVQTFSESDGSPEPAKNNAQNADNEKNAVSSAIVAAFQQSQEEYSDYAIPAGVTYDMPKIGIAYTKPVKGVVSSPFGYRMHPTEKKVKFHFGTDIAAGKGTEINAFADGKVIAAGESTTLGNYVIIRHGSIESEYGHCSKLYVRNGQAVTMGEKIAAVGNTGNATEACLHFELKVSGVYVNPEYYIKWQ